MILIIILLTSVISFLAFSNRMLFDRLKFNAWYIHHDREWYRLFSYSLVHADWGHLLINMFVLWSFSSVVMQFFDRDFGQVAGYYFLLLYIGGVLFATLWDFAKNRKNIYYNAVGASGAVAAVVFASIILNPNGRIFMFFIPIGIPSWLFGIFYLAYSVYMGKRGQDNIGHNAHFFGAIFGIIFTLLINPDYLRLFYNQLGIQL